MKVLAIDDRKDNVLVYRAILKRVMPEAELIAAFSGAEGLKLLEEENPDIILLDLFMPEMDGLQVARRIRSTPPFDSIPIVVITAAETGTQMKVKALEAGADALLNKPVDESELLAQMRAMVRMRRSEQELQKQKAGLEIAVAERTQELEMSNEALARALEQTVYVLARTVESKDPYTSGHQRRVAALASELAREMGLSEDLRKGVYLASMIHDIGKIQIPGEILSKPGAISTVERGLIQRHPEIGARILEDIDLPWPVAEIVHQHHERLDGSGYPRRLSGGDILPEARILAVADVVEAMSSHRPYRPALGIEAAITEVSENAGKLYDRDVAQACVEIFEQGFSFDRGIDPAGGCTFAERTFKAWEKA
ncbi:MAG: HD domain-containing phosphohydrolase [Thermovirgaceae bacterium]